MAYTAEYTVQTVVDAIGDTGVTIMGTLETFAVIIAMLLIVAVAGYFIKRRG